MSDTALMRREEPSVRVEVDEEGMLRAVTRPEHIGTKVRYIVGLSTPKSREAAWKVNPTCAHCDTTVTRVDDAALVITPNKEHRIAHRGECFVLALIATHPAITTGKPVRYTNP